MQPVFDAVEKGEALVLASKHPLLRHLHCSNVIRWCVDGKIPALKIGRSFFTTDRLVKEALAPQPVVKKSVKGRHLAALQSIRKTLVKKGGA